MRRTTAIRSWPAIGLGTFFAGVTGFVLFKDVLDGAPVNTAHVLSLAAIVAAIASGHMAWPQLQRGSVIPAALLAILFAGSTAYVVLSSGARNAETAGAKTARIAETNAARVRELAQLAQAEAMHASAERKLDADCVRGRASKSACDGIRATLAVYAAAIKGHNATLKELGPELPPAGGYAHAARVLAALPGVTATPAAIEERLTLLLPFIVVLIAELGTITFLHIGLGQGTPATASAPAVEERAAPSVPVDPSPGRRSRRGATEKDANVVAFVDAYRRRHGRDPSIRDLQAAFPGLPHSTAARYRRRPSPMPPMRLAAG